MAKKEKSIIEPRPIRGFSRRLIIHLPYLPPKSNLLPLIQQKALRWQSFEGYTLFLLPKNVLIYGAIGAPLAIMVGERLIASGGQEIILLGLAGSLTPHLRIGQAFLVDQAIANEGTSAHYFPNQKTFPASPELTLKIENVLKEQGLEIKKATVISTDAPFRETKSWLKEARKKGAEAVDMEASAWLALAHYYGLKAAALFIISDELFTQRWRPGFSHSFLLKNCYRYFYPLLDLGESV